MHDIALRAIKNICSVCSIVCFFALSASYTKSYSYNGGGGGKVAALIIGIISFFILIVSVFAFWHRSRRVLTPKSRLDELLALAVTCCAPVYGVSMLLFVSWSLGKSANSDLESNAMMTMAVVGIILASVCLFMASLLIKRARQQLLANNSNDSQSPAVGTTSGP